MHKRVIFYNMKTINTDLLSFNVLAKPDKDFFKIVQANAKFKTLKDVIMTKVGINNFYNFSIAIKSTIVLRDILLNSQFVSGWARSSQVLNSTDSKFSVYKFFNKNEEETAAWIKTMEDLEQRGHSMDNMRSMIWLGSMTEFAMSIDLLHLVYLALVLDSIASALDEKNEALKAETSFFLEKISSLLSDEYEVNFKDYSSMLNDAFRDFNAVDSPKSASLADITQEKVFSINATYSVVGQVWRHRTVVKRYAQDTYSEVVETSKSLTAGYDFNEIELHKEIADNVKKMTTEAEDIYSLVQGSIVAIQFSGTIGAIHKMLCQRTCYINDSPQFKDAFELFKSSYPELKLLPPCKLNSTSTNSCYVSYVNESRRKNEEKTQVPCPVYCKARGYKEDFCKAFESAKTQWYLENLDYWKKSLSN